MDSEKTLKMFGVEDLDAFVEEIKESITYQVGGKNMSIMSLLSDAQEELAVGASESVRQTINLAKFLLSELPLNAKGL